MKSSRSVAESGEKLHMFSSKFSKCLELYQEEYPRRNRFKQSRFKENLKM